MKPHQNEKKIKRGDFSSEHILYENGDQFVFGTFLSWDNHQVTHISVRSNFLKIRKVFFCPKLDQLEISGSQGTTIQPLISKLEDCYINREVVTIIEHDDDVEYECVINNDKPEVKKGNILVGQ